MPMMMSLIRAAATAGCEYCPNGKMEMSTLGTTTLLVDLAQLVEQGSVKEFEKTGRDVVEKGIVALSESLIVASSDTLETYRTNTTRCTNDSCSAMIEEERDDEDEEATSAH